jgi:hypothetical protein
MLEQMKECDESINATGSRKKKRRSGFRFSSQKVLDRSRLTRLTKAGVCEIKSVTRTLSYPSDTQCIAGASFESPVLASIDEFEEERTEASKVDQLKASDYPKMVSCSLKFSI